MKKCREIEKMRYPETGIFNRLSGRVGITSETGKATNAKSPKIRTFRFAFTGDAHFSIE